MAAGGSGGWAGAVNLTAGDRPVRARSALVDDHLLATLGVQPAQGRLFAPGETDAMSSSPGIGGPPVAILSHELWQSAFGGQPIVGQTVQVDGRPHDIIGIMPPGFDVMDNRTEIWLPIGVHPVIRRLRENHILQVIGRLKDGVTPQAAEAELATFLDNWGERVGVQGPRATRARPSRPQDHTLRLQPLQDAILGDARRVIWVLQTAAGLVLLIACANLASLVLARAESRRREFAVRAALGASRGRLIQQTITEGVLLSVAGGAIGLWVARIGLRSLVLAYPTSLPRTSELTIDLPVLLFALVVSVATGVLFGVAPAVQSRFIDLVNALKEGHRDGGTAGRHRVRRALVTAEVALAVMLVIGAGLLVRTVYNLTRVDAGFDRSRMVTFSMTLPRSGTEAGGRALALQRLLDTLRQMPGVQAATAMSDLPFNRLAQRYNTGAENYANTDGRPVAVVDYYQFVMSDYFTTMRIPIVAGRGFDAIDTASEGRVVIINETLANRLWKGRDPIGQRLRPNLGASIGTSANPWHTVIGVAKDVKEAGVDRDAGAELYLFVDQPGPPIDGTSAGSPPLRPPCTRPAHESFSVRARADTGASGPRRQPVGPDRRLARDGRGVRRINRPAEAPGAAARRIRGAGAAAGSARHLWRAVVHGRGAAARDRHSCRDRRDARQHRRARHEAGARHRVHRSGRGTCGGAWPEPSARIVAVRRGADGSGHAGRRHVHDCDGGRTGVRTPGVASLAARPERRA